MATVVTRSGKGSPLTNTEVDSNFTNLNTDKAELSGAAFTGNITAPTVAIGGWTVTEDAGSLYFSYNLSRKMRLDTSGNLDVVGSFNSAATLPALAGSTSIYAILTLEPKFVLDFKRGAYKKAGTATTLGSAITHTAASNATMVDSDGLLKWRPHNLMTNSGDLSLGAWNGDLSVSAVTTGSPFGTYQTISPSSDSTTAAGASQRFQIGKAITSGATYGGWALVKYSAGSGFFDLNLYDTGKGNELAWFDVKNGVVGAKQSLIVDHGMIDYGDGWWLCFATSIATSNSGGFSVEVPNGDGVGSCSTADDLLIAGTQFYRSDLGGMVDNYTYVPTTTSPIYGPRVGHHIYNGSAWVNEGILHESEARTNLVTNSGDLSGTGWTGSAYRGSVTSGSPFGTYHTLSPASTSTSMGGAQRYQIGKTISSGSTYVGWALVKYSAGSGWFDLNIYDTSKGNEKAWFDLQNGVVGTKEALIIDHGMVDYGDGWWLCWASAAAASGSGGVSIEVPNGDGLGACSAGDVILIAGTQFELGSTPSSYISTSGSAATRSAETLTVPAANLPYDSTNMSIQMDGKMTYADGIVSSEVEMYRWILSSSNYINSTVQAYAAKTGEPVFSQRQASSGLDSVVGSGNTYAPGTDVPFNLAVRHGSTFINAAMVGTSLTANTTPTILPDLSATDLTLGFDFMGTIGQFRVWDEDLTDAGIVGAST